MYKVLIVEDEDIIRKGLIFMIDWLKAKCVIVGEASDGREGLKKIKECKPDIVITDIKMPFKDGLELLCESIDEYKYDAIIISGYGEFEYAKKAINLGVTEYLLKPVDPDELYKALKKIDEKRAKVSKEPVSLSLKDILDTSVYESNNYKIRHVSKLIEFIKSNYMEKISLTKLSSEYGLSCAYLNTKFKEETSYTFNDFLNRYRIIQSVKLLEDGSLKIYEVAQKVGFTDYKYFIEVFKKYIGCSPTKFLNSGCVVKKDI